MCERERVSQRGEPEERARVVSEREWAREVEGRER